MVDPEMLAAWVETSCAVQGAPVRVTDPGVLANVGVLMGAAGGAPDGSAAPSAEPRPHSRHVGTTRLGSSTRTPGVPGRIVA